MRKVNLYALSDTEYNQITRTITALDRLFGSVPYQSKGKSIDATFIRDGLNMAGIDIPGTLETVNRVLSKKLWFPVICPGVMKIELFSNDIMVDSWILDRENHKGFYDEWRKNSPDIKVLMAAANIPDGYRFLPWSIPIMDLRSLKEILLSIVENDESQPFIPILSNGLTSLITRARWYDVVRDSDPDIYDEIKGRYFIQSGAYQISLTSDWSECARLSDTLDDVCRIISYAYRRSGYSGTVRISLDEYMRLCSFKSRDKARASMNRALAFLKNVDVRCESETEISYFSLVAGFTILKGVFIVDLSPTYLRICAREKNRNLMQYQKSILAISRQRNAPKNAKKISNLMVEHSRTSLLEPNGNKLTAMYLITNGEFPKLPEVPDENESDETEQPKKKRWKQEIITPFFHALDYLTEDHEAHKKILHSYTLVHRGKDNTPLSEMEITRAHNDYSYLIDEVAVLYQMEDEPDYSLLKLEKQARIDRATVRKDKTRKRAEAIRNKEREETT